MSAGPLDVVAGESANDPERTLTRSFANSTQSRLRCLTHRAFRANGSGRGSESDSIGSHGRRFAPRIHKEGLGQKSSVMVSLSAGIGSILAAIFLFSIVGATAKWIRDVSLVSILKGFLNCLISLVPWLPSERGRTNVQ